MAKRNNPVLGEIKCEDCGGAATVHQTARGAGRYLYTRCGECGPDQRTGAAVQTRLWYQTTWRDGAPEAKPPNLREPKQEPEEPKTKPVEEPNPEPSKPAENQGKTGFWWLLGGVGAVVAILAGRA